MSKVLTSQTIKEIDHWLGKFPKGKQRSAIIGSLHAVQHQNHGFLTSELMDAVAEYLDVPRIQVYEVASFYSMFQTKKVGKHEISICTNISCMLRGSDEILGYVEERLGISVGESTPDGNIFLKKEEECLAACTGAPMMMVDHAYIEDLDIKKVDEVIDNLMSKS
ncbi:MAG: NAD(P)H-dependent oxidoreductase subunit E [Proteobacteria bacterium]|nr:NAD(P)H-dependent oxidoreductase subunit E [Pseudomonadota bacterium]